MRERKEGWHQRGGAIPGEGVKISDAPVAPSRLLFILESLHSHASSSPFLSSGGMATSQVARE